MYTVLNKFYLIAQRAVRRAALNALKGWVLDDITLYEPFFFETLRPQAWCYIIADDHLWTQYRSNYIHGLRLSCKLLHYIFGLRLICKYYYIQRPQA